MNELIGRPSSRWAIVLAGGEGERLRPLIRQYMGSERPKQYCTFASDKTLLEETLMRALRVVPAERILTVIGNGHRRFLEERAPLAGRFIEQPIKRETAPGIFLPASHIFHADPSATVLIFPSDHYISPANAFINCVNTAAALAESQDDKIVMLGATPEGPEEDYGWIEPNWSSTTAAGAMPVMRFKEKPSSRETIDLFERGCLWNTMIMAVKIQTLWDIGQRCLPDMMQTFDSLLSVLNTPQESPELISAYRCLQSFNFSRDIVERIPKRVMVLPMRNVAWSDLGRPDRALRILKRYGRNRRIAPVPAQVKLAL